MHTKHNDDRRSKAKSILSTHGYGKMADLATKSVHEHEQNMHKGKKETKLKLASGGAAKGAASKMRLDRQPRASGGRNKKHKGHKEPHVSVNVINAGSKQPVPMPMPGMGGPKPPMPPPPAMGAAPGMPPMAPKPPMAMGAPPPGAMPPRPFKAGGPVRNKMKIPHLDGGSGGGLGRLQKAEHESKRKKSA